MSAFEVDPRWTMRKVEMPFEHDGVRVTLNGYFISPRNATEAAARPLTLSSAGGLDWTSAGMVPWVMPLVEEGFNVLIYEGPGQGDTLRVHNYGFIPQWDRVIRRNRRPLPLRAALDGRLPTTLLTIASIPLSISHPHLISTAPPTKDWLPSTYCYGARD